MLEENFNKAIWDNQILEDKNQKKILQKIIIKSNYQIKIKKLNSFSVLEMNKLMNPSQIILKHKELITQILN